MRQWVVEKENGVGAVVGPVGLTKIRRRRRPKTEADYEAFLASAGGTTSCEALMFYRILLTRNVKDFQRIPGLKLYRPG